MFVLYRFDGDDNFSFLCTSENRENLETYKQSLIYRFDAEQKTVDELNKQRESYINKYKKTLQAYMIDNLDAVRDYDVNANHIKPFDKSWHSEYLKQYKLYLINKYTVQSSIYNMFQKGHGLKIWEKVLDNSKIKGEIPFIDPEKIAYHVNKFNESADTLFIDEVEHLI